MNDRPSDLLPQLKHNRQVTENVESSCISAFLEKNISFPRHETFIELTTILKKIHDIDIRLMEIEFISDDKDDEASMYNLVINTINKPSCGPLKS